MAEAFLQIGEPGQTRPKRACRTRAVGIDLGTTNSLVAVVDGGKPVCLPDAHGDAIVPSVVHYAADGSVVVGAEARDRLAAQFPRDTIASVKRFMGRGPQDAEATRRLTPYEFAPAAGDGQVVRFAVAGGRTVTPMEVSAEILKVLKTRAEGELGGALAGAVITVPAYFDDGQRQATRDAGRLAGLEVLRLLNEPTAAAVAYGLDKQAEGTFAVFDLGGGTFDISILKLEDGVFEVKSTGGDSALGGDDFDRAIADLLLQKLRQAAPNDAPIAALSGASGAVADLATAQRWRQVLDAARAMKEALTFRPDVSTELPTADGAVTVGLTRTEMELAVEPVLARCTPPVRRALADAGVAAPALSGVILVGGATRMPLVQQFVEKLFGRPPLGDIDPDQVVALGAALQADALAGGSTEGDMLLLDVVPLSLGLETMGGVVEKLIHRNTTVPCGATQTFTTFADKQTGFDLHVVQGERELADQCRSLARFTLKGIPPMPAGMARLEVTFTVDADGILRVAAREETTGQEASVQVKPSYGLTDEEVERMLLDSFAHAEEDVQTRQLTEQRVEADRIAAAARAAMADSPELLTDEDRRAIDVALADLESARQGSDHHVIRRAVEALDEASKAFAARRMNVAFERGLRGKDVGEVEAKADETAGKRDLAARVASHAGHTHERGH
ncbi:MAG TPA: Fe-S protein assembly chaperone HscA [Polyangia bacterium]|nr:Fe-S protein assembly chaperone HscA [Polyangia bacterium]